MMRFQHIRYFLVLCEEQNFTRTAKRCGITQPSLTNAIKKLENLLGGPLFHRGRKPTSVTKPTGLALVVKPYFEQAHFAVEAAQRKASVHALVLDEPRPAAVVDNPRPLPQ
jgi:LysR family hydrogen peroxide-inducible transcriptional activator